MMEYVRGHRGLMKVTGRIIYILLIALTFFVLDALLSVKTAHGIRQAKCMYAQPADTIDVVMLGSSHIHCDVNTALLWEEYGIAGYDYSAAEQPLWITYYYLREICKYQKPRVVVLDLFCPAHFKDNYQYTWIRDNWYGMRFSLNKVQMMLESAELREIGNYFPAFTDYHNRYKNVGKEDFASLLESNADRAAFKGYTPYFGGEIQEEPVLDQDLSGGITVKSEIYLQKIIDYTKENDIELFLVVTPYITSSEDELVYNRIREIAEQEGIEFNSTNYDYSVIGLDFDTDFNDYSHLNYYGSCKFTRYLADELLERFEIPDRRGDERYESWDRHAAQIEAIAERELSRIQ